MEEELRRTQSAIDDIQTQILRAQREQAQQRFTRSSRDGLVEVEVNGYGMVRSVRVNRPVSGRDQVTRLSMEIVDTLMTARQEAAEQSGKRWNRVLPTELTVD